MVSGLSMVGGVQSGTLQHSEGQETDLGCAKTGGETNTPNIRSLNFQFERSIIADRIFENMYGTTYCSLRLFECDARLLKYQTLYYKYGGVHSGQLICTYSIHTLQHCYYRMDSINFMISDVIVINAGYSMAW